MQLREIHVVRFGVLDDVRIRRLSSGLNVLYGPNEFGKSTLLEFVRRVLFGFPNRTTRANQYMLPHVDKNAGHLACEMRDGTLIEVSRTTGKGPGPLMATTSDGTSLSEDQFLARLGHVSYELYRSVFSLDLAELFETEVTSIPEVKDRIYSAGFGGISPTKLRADFQKTADELFTKGGRLQRIKKLADGIAACTAAIEYERAKLARYDDKKRERERLSLHGQELSALVNEARSALRTLEHQEHLYATVQELRVARQDLAGMGDVVEVKDETLAELHERQSSLKTLDGQAESKRNELDEKRAALERIVPDAAVLAHESDIRSLSQRLARYRSALEELPDLNSQVSAARANLGRRLASVGPDWTEERVRAFNLTAGQRDSLRQQEAFLRERAEALEKAKQRLGLHRDQALGRASSGSRVPVALRVAGIAVLVFGGAGAAFSAVNGDTTTAVFAGVAAAVGLLIAVLPGSGSSRGDGVDEQLKTEADQAEQSLLKAENDWSECLVRVGLSPTFSPQAKDEALREIEDSAKELSRIDEMTARATRLRDVVGDIDELYRQVATDVKGFPAATDPSSGIQLLDSALAKAREQMVRRETLAEDIRTLDEQAVRLQDRRRDEMTALQSFLAAYGISSPAELEERYRRHRAAEDLRKTIEGKMHDIGTRVGQEDACATLIETVEATPLEDIRTAIDQTNERIEQLEGELTEANRQVGALDSELSELESEEKLGAQEANVEVQKEQLKEAYHDWLTARIALWGIESAVSRYEEERQPDVIRAAQETFVMMTEGRYERIIKPLDSDDVRVRDRSGNDRTVDQLSRGTREQLHLAIRLGLVEQYEQNSEPLPVIMDDILVNFDDERGPLAVQALAEFAKGRQVIVMTCHDRTREMYRQAGANELSMSASPG